MCPRLRIRGLGPVPPGFGAGFDCNPTPLSAGNVPPPLRTTTTTNVVQRQWLFDLGEVLDAARVSETLRKLRRQMLYNDVSMDANICGPDVDLTVNTRDTWGLRANANVTPPNVVALPVEDRNFLGSRRRLSLSEAKSQT